MPDRKPVCDSLAGGPGFATNPAIAIACKQSATCTVHAWQVMLPRFTGEFSVRICHACLVVVDISGYTRFITERSLTLAHAEQIISDLMNAVLDQAQHPLVLNKLEGDAALLYAEVDVANSGGFREILSQVRSFFPAFSHCASELSKLRQNCSCDACRNISALSIKAFVHTGDILLKQIRQFEEVAGEPVILLHRLMKNGVEGSEYVLLSDAAMRGAGLDQADLRSHIEEVDGMGTHQLWLADASNLPESNLPAPAIPISNREDVPKTGTYRNLPVMDLEAPAGNWLTRLLGWRGN
jgi:hypothetical protein